MSTILSVFLLRQYNFFVDNFNCKKEQSVSGVLYIDIAKASQVQSPISTHLVLWSWPYTDRVDLQPGKLPIKLEANTIEQGGSKIILTDWYRFVNSTLLNNVTSQAPPHTDKSQIRTTVQFSNIWLFKFVKSLLFHFLLY